MKKAKTGDVIEFFCVEEDWDVIAKPVPATKHLPTWFKSLPPKLGENAFGDSTIKRCMPFLDAMTAGWLIPLGADVHITTSEDGSFAPWRSTFGSETKPMIEYHALRQVSGAKVPHPMAPRQPMKFMNYWFIKVPKEYSLLFISPLEREDKRFRCLPGLVDSPYAEREYVNFPFLMLKDNFNGVIEKGTPLVQVIPVRKDSFLPQGVFRKQTVKEAKSTALLRRQRTAHESHYRDYVRREVK
jgi:hypothetical protein